MSDLLEPSGYLQNSGGIVLSKPPLNELLERLYRIRAVLADRLNEVDKLIKEARSLETKVVDLASEAVVQESLPLEFESPRSRRRGVLPPEEIARQVRAILKEAGEPMTRGQIAKALASRGVPLAGKDRNKNVGTIMWRHPNLFVNLPKLGYWLRDVELPGIYTPTDAT
jgi:hypothetical protein